MIPLFKVFMADDAHEAVARVLSSGQIAQGPIVDEFEAALAERFGAPVVTVNSGTSAIELALHLCGVEPEDEVITTAQTCIATNVGIVRRGAIPVFVDVHPDSGLIDSVDVRRNLTSKTKAIVAVDWAGHPCDYDALKSFGPPVIEDAAHAVGTKYRDRHVAVSGGDYVCFSFQAIKHLTTGDGGALVVPSKQLDRARRLRWFGLDRDAKVRFRFEQDIPEAGYKYQLNDIAAAIGLSNLAHLDRVLVKHRENAAFLYAHLINIKGVELPPWRDGSSWWLFTIRVDHPYDFIEKMAERGVAVSPVHARNDVITACARVGRNSTTLKGLDSFSSHQVSIPVGWWLTEEDKLQIVRAVRECV